MHYVITADIWVQKHEQMVKPFLISGPCLIEGREMAFAVACQVKAICERQGFRYIFKGSFRKANRTRLDSDTGIGDDEALHILREINEQLGVEVLTDVHERSQVEHVAAHVTHLQIPAFLCRQTDLLLDAGRTGCTINIKKGQFLSPEAAGFAIEKVQSTGNENVWICERGVSFGYHDLIVDATSVTRLKRHGVPVVIDCTHAVQKPNQTDGVTGGDPELIESVALSAAACGADGFFIETHPDPKNAMSDSGSMLHLPLLEPLLMKIGKIRAAIG